MKKIIALIIAVLFVFSVTAVSFAAEEKKAAETTKKETATTEKKTEKKKTIQVTGQIKAIDAAGKTITVVKKVKAKEVETVISVDDKTLASHKVGDKVTAKYTKEGDKNVAKSVVKKTETKKSETKKEEKKTEPAK